MRMIAGWLCVVLALLADPIQDEPPSFRALTTYKDFELRLYGGRQDRPASGPGLRMGSKAHCPYAVNGFSRAFLLPSIPLQDPARLVAVSRSERSQLLSAIRRVGLIAAGEVQRSSTGELQVEVLDGYGGPPTPLSQGPLG